MTWAIRNCLLVVLLSGNYMRVLFLPEVSVYYILTRSPLSSMLRAFPHGKETATLAAVACSVVAFGISIGEFQIETHVPGFLAMILTVATTFTKVPATGLIAAAVLSFLNGFYAMFMIVTLMPHNPCKAEDFRSSHEEFCNERPGLLLYNCASTLLWGATGLLILKIPQPGDYERGQTTGALVQSLIQERVVKMGCCGQFG